MNLAGVEITGSRSRSLPKETFLGLKSNRATLKLFRELGLLSEASKGRFAVEDDGYNVAITLKSTGCPLYAIEYIMNCLNEVF